MGVVKKSMVVVVVNIDRLVVLVKSISFMLSSTDLPTSLKFRWGEQWDPEKLAHGGGKSRILPAFGR